MLFISRFSFNLYPVNNDDFCLVIYHIKNAIISHMNAIALFLCELFRTMRHWIRGKGENFSINSKPIFYWNLFCLFLSLSFYYNLIGQSLSQVLRNLSYGQKFLGTLRNQRTDISGPAPLRFLFIVIALILFCKSLADAVPVIPNEAILRGTVMEYCLTSSTLSGISPEQVLYKLLISVEETEDVERYPNLLKGKKGQVLTFFTKENLSLEVFGKRIKARVKYMGDEKGGRFWINSIEIIKKED